MSRDCRPLGGKAGEADIRQQRLCGPQPVEKIPGPEQQQPRQQGKIVRGHEARAGKAQPRREKICVPAPRQHKYRNPGKAEKPVIDVPHQQKQAERTGQPQPGRNAVQPPPQRHGQQHCCSQKCQHAEAHRVLRHRQRRNKGHGQPAAEAHQPPAQRMAPHLPAVAGQQDKRAADALLPDIGPEAVIPTPRQSPEINKIPAAVIGHHAQQRQPPQGIQRAGAIWFHSAPPLRDILTLINVP